VHRVQLAPVGESGPPVEHEQHQGDCGVLLPPVYSVSRHLGLSRRTPDPYGPAAGRPESAQLTPATRVGSATTC
jgi:hypothetical protein